MLRKLRTWTEVSRDIARIGARPMPLDLPGFGQERDQDGGKNGWTIDAAVHKMILEIKQSVRAKKMFRG
jgi:hypothetical protein